MMGWSKRQLKDALAPGKEEIDLAVETLEEDTPISAEANSPEERTGDSVPIPTVLELLNPLLTAMHALGGSGSNREIEEQVISLEKFTEEQLSALVKYRSGKIERPKILKNLAYARTYLKDFGILVNPEPGKWDLTEKGQQTYTVDPNEVNRAYDKQRRSRKAEREAKKAKSEETSNPSTEFLHELQATLRQRRIRPPEGSYTAELFAAGPTRIVQKVGEEALEVVIATLHETRERQVSEIADLLVHTLILLVELNIPLEEVLSELERRHQARST